METEISETVPTQASVISVVVIEDDPALRDIVSTWMQEAEGFSFLGAFPDAESAALKLPELRPDVAIVDINLPGLSGIDCVRTLKPRLPRTQFVMLTVYEDSNHLFRALSVGATGYLIKTTPREAVIKAVRDVHAGGSPMTSNIARKVVQSLQHANPKIKPKDELSKRENEVLAFLAQGYLYKEIAETMGVGLQTVNTYIRRIYEKLHVHSRGQAVAIYANLRRRGGL